MEVSGGSIPVVSVGHVSIFLPEPASPHEVRPEDMGR